METNLEDSMAPVEFSVSTPLDGQKIILFDNAQLVKAVYFDQKLLKHTQFGLQYVLEKDYSIRKYSHWMKYPEFKQTMDDSTIWNQLSDHNIRGFGVLPDMISEVADHIDLKQYNLVVHDGCYKYVNDERVNMTEPIYLKYDRKSKSWHENGNHWSIDYPCIWELIKIK